MKKGTYLYTVLLALDRFGAALFFNRADLCISTLCWIVATTEAQMAQAHYRVPAAIVTTPLDRVALEAFKALKLSMAQYRVLLWIADALEWLSPGHCVRSRLTDLDVLKSTSSLLGA